MDIVEALRADYSRFPKNQTYSLYAENVAFKDPLSQFQGRGLFKAMLQFMDLFFLNCQMDLHAIDRTGNTIRTEWTLSWNTPLPWKPRIQVSGSSVLELNDEGAIASQIDYWNCSRLDVLKQHFQPAKTDR